jgi:hypothetical protein
MEASRESGLPDPTRGKEHEDDTTEPQEKASNPDQAGKTEAAVPPKRRVYVRIGNRLVPLE